MLRSNNNTFINLLALLLVFSSCQKEDKLLGHWHIRNIEMDTISAFSGYSTIDVLSDSIAIFDKDGADGYEFIGFIDRKKKTISFGGECMFLNFRYTLEGDILYLNQEEYSEEEDKVFIGKKCDSLCCWDKQKEYFRHSKLYIDLPLVKDTSGFLSHKDVSFIRPLKIGVVKKEYEEYYNYGYLLSINDDIVTINQIKLWHEKSILKIPENKRGLVRIAIYADVNTSKKLLNEVLETLKTMKLNHFLLAFKENSPQFNIWYLSVDLEKYSTEEIINLQQFSLSVR